MSKHRPRAGFAPSQRQLRVAELVRRALADEFARGNIYDEDLIGVSITVCEVQPSADLRQAAVYVLPLGGKEPERIIKALNRNRGFLRHALNKQVSLKFSPELKFHVDTSFDQFDATQELLNREEVKRDTK